MDIKSISPRTKQNQIAKHLRYSNSTLQGYRHDKNMLSPHRIPTNSHKRKQKISNTTPDDTSNRKHDLKRPEMASNDLKRPQLSSKKPVTEKFKRS